MKEENKDIKSELPKTNEAQENEQVKSSEAKETKKGFLKKDPKEKEIKELKAKITELSEKTLRITAEMQNMRRRYDEEKSNMAKYEGQSLIKNLLPIIDNFERAIAMDTSENDKYLEGYKMIYTNMLNILKNIGVEEIDCLHKPFDPNIMEAVLTESIIEEEQGVVLDVLQKGYMYKDRLIRPAMVKVNE